MDEINTLRTQLNTLDKEIMDRLNKRFSITKEIGRIKKEHALPVVNITREKAILSTADKYDYKDEIKTLYQTLFIISKANQK